MHQQKRRSFIGENEDSIFDILLNDESSFTTNITTTAPVDDPQPGISLAEIEAVISMMK